MVALLWTSPANASSLRWSIAGNRDRLAARDWRRCSARALRPRTAAKSAPLARELGVAS